MPDALRFKETSQSVDAERGEKHIATGGVEISLPEWGAMAVARLSRRARPRRNNRQQRD